jgi:hypothetical protein
MISGLKGAPPEGLCLTSPYFACMQRYDAVTSVASIMQRLLDTWGTLQSVRAETGHVSTRVRLEVQEVMTSAQHHHPVEAAAEATAVAAAQSARGGLAGAYSPGGGRRTRSRLQRDDPNAAVPVLYPHLYAAARLLQVRC